MAARCKMGHIACLFTPRYIINHYDNLPEIIIFHHADRYQWHNDDPLYDSQRVLSRLQLPYVIEQGYVSLRCVWTLGCPTEIRPFIEDDPVGSHEDTQPKDARTGVYFKEAFEELFPDFIVPEAVGLSCCAQFAVTGKKIRERPRQDYKRYREWLLTTQLRDDLGGRLVEYFWHSKLILIHAPVGLSSCSHNKHLAAASCTISLDLKIPFGIRSLDPRVDDTSIDIDTAVFEEIYC